ncbi:DUF1707 domain-containing protein [Pseudonocardia sp.]|jgi:hypothetical protein|uniref:DUF1707 SHOCT-like domain-containing protein n=1 Tax=Pseudonocardia sp. TaxID=60912 RepID=UPI0031FD6FA8
MSTTDEHLRTSTPTSVPTLASALETASPLADPPPQFVRASDAERQATVELLHQALSEGRLDLSETDERVAAAYAARYRHELPLLLADLPSSDREAHDGAPTWAQVWASVVWRARTSLMGPAGADEPPTAAHRRLAALLTALAALWMLVCAFLGAGLTG